MLEYCEQFTKADVPLLIPPFIHSYSLIKSVNFISKCLEVGRHKSFLTKNNSAPFSVHNGYKLGKKIYEGKTKQVFDLPEVDGHVLLLNKDRITAGDGARAHDLEGKAEISNQTNAKVFGILNAAGIFFLQQVQKVPLFLTVQFFQVSKRASLNSRLRRRSLRKNVKWSRLNGWHVDWQLGPTCVVTPKSRKDSVSHRRSRKHSSRTTKITIHSGLKSKLSLPNSHPMVWSLVRNFFFVLSII